MNTLRSSRGVLAGGLLTGLLVGLVWVSQDRGLTSEVDPSAESLVNAPILPEVCDGPELTYDQAKAESRFDVLLPHHEAANRDRLTNLRRCGPGVYMMNFDSGLRVSIEFNHLANPEAKFRSMDADYDDVSYGEVDGFPAMLTKPVDNPENPGDGSVIFAKGRVLVEVIGNVSTSLDELVEVAKSLREE